MLTRRDFLQVAAATAGMGLLKGAWASTSNRLRFEDLTAFEPVGQVTLLNFTDIHAQLMPLYYREPSSNLGVGHLHGLPPHITGKELLRYFGLKSGTAEAYAFTHDDFERLARAYGRVGGVAHLATLIKAIRAERTGRTLLVDCGDTWQGSYTALKTSGMDMVEVMNAMGVELMTAHWEFTYGEARVKELIAALKFPFLAGNVVDVDWEEDVFAHTAFFERGGVKIAVIGQAFPYTPVANPRYMMPKWSFGIREEKVQQRVDQAREAGAELVVLASHNGFEVDRKLAARVNGIDVILTGHTHDAIPALIPVGDTLLVAAGSHGKFLARLDLEVKHKRIVRYGFRLIPVFSDAIPADQEIATLVNKIREPYAKALNEELATTDSLLYRRGHFNGTFDDLICNAILQERDCEIALSPGFRWGSALLSGDSVRLEDVYSHTAITYPNCYRQAMSGGRIKEILEDVADNLFNPDPYYQQGGDMVRVGGLGYTIDIRKPMGDRISNMIHLTSGTAIDPQRDYMVGGWASVNPDTAGPPIYDLVADYLRREKRVNLQGYEHVKVLGA